jgi:hypothetical protein
MEQNMTPFIEGETNNNSVEDIFNDFNCTVEERNGVGIFLQNILMDHIPVKQMSSS